MAIGRLVHLFGTNPTNVTERDSQLFIETFHERLREFSQFLEKTYRMPEYLKNQGTVYSLDHKDFSRRKISNTAKEWSKNLEETHAKRKAQWQYFVSLLIQSWADYRNQLATKGFAAAEIEDFSFNFVFLLLSICETLVEPDKPSGMGSKSRGSWEHRDSFIKNLKTIEKKLHDAQTFVKSEPWMPALIATQISIANRAISQCVGEIDLAVKRSVRRPVKEHSLLRQLKEQFGKSVPPGKIVGALIYDLRALEFPVSTNAQKWIDRARK